MACNVHVQNKFQRIDEILIKTPIIAHAQSMPCVFDRHMYVIIGVLNVAKFH